MASSDWEIARVESLIRGQHFRSAGAILVGVVIGVILAVTCIMLGIKHGVNQ